MCAERASTLPSTGLRSSAIDLIRVIGIIGVVWGHVNRGEFTTFAFYPWHVPVFFFLTGYLWTPGRTLRTEVGKRWRTLAIPYITWLAVIWLLLLGSQLAAGSLDLHSLATPLWGGSAAVRPFSAFWFVSALFFAAILCRLFELFPAWLGWVATVIGILACYAIGGLVAKAPLSLGLALPCAFFVLCGALLRRFRFRIRYSAVLSIVALSISFSLVLTGVSAPLDLKRGDFGTPGLSVVVAVMISASLVVLAEAAVPRLPMIVQRGVIELAAGGLFVILTHAVVLWVLATPNEGSWHELLLALVIPWFLALLAVRTPFSPALTGGPRRAPIRDSTARE